MLLYFKKAEPNLTLDHFERGSISQRFSLILQRLNWRRSELCKIYSLSSGGTGMETIYIFDDPQEIKVILFLSNIQNLYRYRNKEKIFSLHINIFRPYLVRLVRPDYKRQQTQTIRPFLKYKRMKLPLGKMRIKNFKGSKV